LTPFLVFFFFLVLFGTIICIEELIGISRLSESFASI